MKTNVEICGGGTPEEIVRFMADAANDAKRVALVQSKTKTSAAMFGENIFGIRINSCTQCLDTGGHIALEYVERTAGASQRNGAARIPPMVEEEFLTQIEAMAAKICEQCRADAGKEPFGCCNDHVRCSTPGVVCTWTTKNTGDAVTGKTLRPGAYFTAGMQSEEELLHEKV